MNRIHEWIPVKQKPKTEDVLLLSFDDSFFPAVGYYSLDVEQFYVFVIEGEEVSAFDAGLTVNAWMLAPKRYVRDVSI